MGPRRGHLEILFLRPESWVERRSHPVRKRSVGHGVQRLLRARDTMGIERGDQRIATVKKAIIDPLRDRFTIDLASGGSMQAQDNILDHEY